MFGSSELKCLLVNGLHCQQINWAACCQDKDEAVSPSSSLVFPVWDPERSCIQALWFKETADPEFKNTYSSSHLCCSSNWMLLVWPAEFWRYRLQTSAPQIDMTVLIHCSCRNLSEQRQCQCLLLSLCSGLGLVSPTDSCRNYFLSASPCPRWRVAMSC